MMSHNHQATKDKLCLSKETDILYKEYELMPSNVQSNANFASRPRAHSLHPGYQSLSEKGNRCRRKSLSSYELGPGSTKGFLEIPQEFLETSSQTAETVLTGSDGSSNFRRSRSFRESPDKLGENLRRVRSFKTTSKGLVNRGDSYKTKRESGSCEILVQKRTDTTIQTFNNYVIPQLITTRSDGEQNYFRVLMIGAQGVGKTSIIDQFMTSEFLGSGDNFSICKFYFLY